MNVSSGTKIDDGSSESVVDSIISSRIGAAKNSWIWRLLRPLVNVIVARSEAAAFVEEIRRLDAAEFFDHFERRLDIDISVLGLENVPTSGAFVLVANHPMGAVDGLVLHMALKAVRRDLVFLASTEALRLAPGIGECIIPVELEAELWDVQSKRRMALALHAALRARRVIVILPAGALSVRKGGQLVEEAWSSSAATLAQRYCLPILPIHIAGRNSWIHYILYAISPTLRDLTTFRETLNKYRARIAVRIGEIIPAPDRTEDTIFITERLRQIVFYELSPLEQITDKAKNML